MKNKLHIFLFITALFFAFYEPGEEWTRTELYFGLSKPDGGSISTDEFNSFADSVISPAFYEGFTVINANGGWFDPEKHRTIYEESRLVIHFSKMDDNISAQIDTIRAKYKRYFNQQAVLRVDFKTSVSF